MALNWSQLLSWFAKKPYAAPQRRRRSQPILLEVLEDRLAPAVLTFQNDVNGYTGSHDTEIKSQTDFGAADRNFADRPTLNVDRPGAQTGGHHAHVLMRFGDVFGNGPNQIPLGSTIHSATLSLWIIPSGTHTDPTMHRLLPCWRETEPTWNNFRHNGNTQPGVQADGLEATSSLRSLPSAPGRQNVSVTAELQLWATGVANHGWAFLPTSAHGVDWYSSEHTDTSQRPLLTVDFTPPETPFPGVVHSCDGSAPIVTDLVVTPPDTTGTVRLTATVSDPDADDSFTVRVNWGDGSTETRAFASGPVNLDLTHQYPHTFPAGTYPVELIVTDSDGLRTTVTTTTTIVNIAPILAEVTANSSGKGDRVQLTAAIRDPDVANTFTLVVSWREGLQETFTFAAGTTSFNVSHIYADDAPTATGADTIFLTLTDNRGGQAQATASTRSSRGAPLVNPTTDVYVGRSLLTPLGSFPDSGREGDWTATVEYGGSDDDLSTLHTDGIFTVSHVHTGSGSSFVVTVTTTEDDGGIDTDWMIITLGSPVERALEG